VLCACIAPAILLALHPLAGRAADALGYDVAIAPTGDDAIDAAARDSATLVQLHDAGAVSPATLVARARADAERLGGALRSLGRYSGQIRISLAGLDLDDPELPEILEALPARDTVAVAITLTPGPVFRLRRIRIDGDAAGQTLDLAPGAPARAGDVLAAGAKLQAALLDAGHALAVVGAPIADVNTASQSLDVTFPVTAGPRVNIGRIDVTGLKGLDESYIRRRLALQSGQPFSPAALEASRADLQKVPAIASVRLNPAAATDADGSLPIELVVVERKAHAISVSAAYSTDQGGNSAVSWKDRNLFGRAEQLTLSAGVSQIGAGAARQPGYLASALLTLPDWLRREQSLHFQALAVRESLDAYDRTAIITGATLSRRLAPHWTGSVGLFGERAHFLQDRVGRDFSLGQVPIGLHYDTSNSPTDATSGTRADATVTPTFSVGKRNAAFVIAQASAAKFFDLAAPGRTVLAVRGLAGSVQGATTFDIPPDQRFYGGGSATIRGYRFQSVGPKLGNRKPAGGTSIAAGTIELRQRFGESYGAVVFVDGGQVSEKATPFTGKFRTGAGIGARYYTGLGPIRADIAIPLQRQRGNDAVEFYLGLGQAF
jgi:translocation and assembly module TamA